MTGRYSAPWPGRMPRSLALPETGVHHNLEVSAARYPDKAALVYYGTEISYERLLTEVDLLAGYLQRELGVAKGDRVILYMQNSPQFVISYYAILRAGAMVVPLNPMLVTEELWHYAEDSEAGVALVSQELHEKVSPLVGHSSLECVIVAAYSDYLQEETDLAVPEVVSAPRRAVDAPRTATWESALRAGYAPEPVEVRSDDAAVLPYTSGTTGKPKGCVHTHRSVQANLISAGVWNNTTSSSVQLATLPLFHVTGMENSMNGPIFLGATVVLMTRWDRELAAELIQRYRCTGWTNIPTMVVDLLALPGVERYDLSSLLVIGGGGAAMPEAVARKLHELTGLQYVEGYGLSETIAATHINPPDRPRLQCLGIPIFDTDSRVVDPVTLEELGPNEQGEIIVSGPQIMRGYWRRPEEDEEAFIELDGKRFFRTGDLGYYDEEGYFFMVDRLKRMINASGYNVWPAEVESVLYKHPAIQEACVIGVPDARRGETVKALVVLREGGESATPEDLIEWSREQMAAYKHPREVEFVPELPKGGSGKILWRELQERERAAQRR